MISLFIDTSLSDIYVAVVRDDMVLASISRSVPNKHSVYATSFLDQVIKEASIDVKEIDKIMVVNGPGSFTGLRIGVTIAKSLAYLLEKDVICLSSLKIRAISVSHDYCMSLIDARHDNYYMGLYDKNNNCVIQEEFVHKDRVLEKIHKYHPLVISDKNFMIEDVEVLKVALDINKIVHYYKDSDMINAHLVVPNYLKLPQVLEKK